MIKQIRLGMLTPSSNTVLEPITSAMIATLPNVSVHFSRFTVTEISLREQALGQFDLERILAAAKLLADARVHVIAWNGTSSGWLGFEKDRALCDQITEATGIPATTSVLALNEILEKTEVRRFGLASPYTTDVQSSIVSNYQRHGFDCSAERHLNLHVNYSFAEVTEDTIREMVWQLARENVQAISTFCTNLRAAHLARELEADTGIPFYDTISTVVWKSLRLANVDTRALKGWGSLFQTVE
ncbi:Asp/Glu/hydantoin racemase [Pandoraea pnomenusa 3kgm]|uniref:maleate cis-trans isomerase family protein n=1 Tax=Pandoraea TaxID=93217 RepID=UPI0003C747D2|nr:MULTISPECIES: aspartate/glutamate racemase family protein [Pandoraea]AHB04874.1 Asp/Glu/hydantoin racemase [Pandoraea pnomenusa 3kgm]AHN76902.1 Asp/Glu/hydantoin racemase [Pandoraea pnomenusa]